MSETERRWQSVLYRYVRRYTHRLAAWIARIGLVAFGVWIFTALFRFEPSGWAMVAVVAVYGVYAISEAMKKLTPVNILTLSVDHMEASDGRFLMDEGALHRAVDRMLKAKASEAEFHPRKERR